MPEILIVPETADTVPDPEITVKSVVEADAPSANVFAAPPRKVVVPKADVFLKVPDIVWLPDVPEKYSIPVLLPELVNVELFVKLPATERRVGADTAPEPAIMLSAVVEALLMIIFTPAPTKVVEPRLFDVPDREPEIDWLPDVPEKYRTPDAPEFVNVELFVKLPATESRVGAVTVPDVESILNAVVDALPVNVLVAAPIKVVVPSAEVFANVPAIV